MQCTFTWVQTLLSDNKLFFTGDELPLSSSILTQLTAFFFPDLTLLSSVTRTVWPVPCVPGNGLLVCAGDDRVKGGRQQEGEWLHLSADQRSFPSSRTVLPAGGNFGRITQNDF
jgi:hypothetical protein